MRKFLIILTYKIEKFFQKISKRRARIKTNKCEYCGDCDECSISGVCTKEYEVFDEINIID